jgi:hypothetical protein
MEDLVCSVAEFRLKILSSKIFSSDKDLGNPNIPSKSSDKETGLITLNGEPALKYRYS